MSDLRAAARSVVDTNGGPIDADQTIDGKAYVMVERSAFDALFAALAAVQEPVAWMNDEGEIELSHKQWMSSVWQPLYTHPAPAAQPLTDEQMANGMEAHGIHGFGPRGEAFIDGARFAERAHGIGGTAP